MSALTIAWLVTVLSVSLVGFAFGVSFGRERERRKFLGKRRSCHNCSGFGHVRTGGLFLGPTFTCPDCHGAGYTRDSSTTLPFRSAA